ncbi:MAG: phospholipase [Bacteroidia bacterium]|nr:phospholipase [Bacteroidia bacterium]
MQPTQHTCTVPRTARYYTLGALGPATREVWFVLHGYGQLARYFLQRFEPIADESRLIVAPEGASRFYLDVPSYTRVGASWMTRDDREHDIADQQQYLNAVYSQVLPQGLPTGVRLVVLGFSQGTATAWRWVCAAPALPVSALVLWAGSIPLEAAPEGRLAGVDLQLYLGDADDIIPRPKAEAYLAQLAAAGIRPAVTWYAGGHTVPESALVALANGLAH